MPRSGIFALGASAGLAALLAALGIQAMTSATPRFQERQLTRGPGGRILTNIHAWSPDGAWIVFDTRPDPAGERFEGRTIAVVSPTTAEVRTVYESARGAHCGVATFHPRKPQVVFILGPEDPTPDWSYNAWHRRGVLVDLDAPGRAHPLDARDLIPPFTPGALRGGSHVHVWHPRGDWVSYTYEDHVLAQPGNGEREPNQRNIGVSVADHPVRVPRTHPRNHDGTAFSVLVSRTVAHPRPGSDDITRACEEGWIGTQGYRRADGERQPRALACLGRVTLADGREIDEVFVLDLPEDLTRPGEGPLQGSATRKPAPPAGVTQRRVTFTGERRHPGVSGPRHWLRSTPDGEAIAFLMKDDQGLAQLWTVSPRGGTPRQLTRNPWPIASAFSWSPDGQSIAHVLDGSVCATDLATGTPTRWTPRANGESQPRPEACVFSPDGQSIAFVRPGPGPHGPANQICVVSKH